MTHQHDTAKPRGGHRAGLIRIGALAFVLSIVLGWLIAWLQFETWFLTAPLLIATTWELMKPAHRRVPFWGPLFVAMMMAIGVGAMSTIAYSLPGKYLQIQLNQMVELPDRSIRLQELAGDSNVRPLMRFIRFDLRNDDGDIRVTFPDEQLTCRQTIESIELQTPYRHRAVARCGNCWSIRWGHDAGYEFWFAHQDDPCGDR